MEIQVSLARVFAVAILVFAIGHSSVEAKVNIREISRLNCLAQLKQPYSREYGSACITKLEKAHSQAYFSIARSICRTADCGAKESSIYKRKLNSKMLESPKNSKKAVYTVYRQGLKA